MKKAKTASNGSTQAIVVITLTGVAVQRGDVANQ